MFKGDRKLKKQYRDADGARMLPNENMVSFRCVHLPVPLECDYLMIFY